MPRVCGNCGRTQGPFDRLFIGNRKTGRWIFTCPVPKNSTEKQRLDAIAACHERRDKRFAARS